MVSNVQGSVAADKLRLFVDKIERLEEEKREIADEIKAVMSEAKSEGFDAKVMKQILKERKQKPHERAEFEELCDLYRAALGMLPGAELRSGPRADHE